MYFQAKKQFEKHFLSQCQTPPDSRIEKSICHLL
jgi:hypothetical protein